MTRDSASGTGPEPDSVNDVTETPRGAEAASSTDATKPVAVDTTDEDTTDEGAVGVNEAKTQKPASETGTPNLTLKPLPSAGQKATSIEDASAAEDASVTKDASATENAAVTGGAVGDATTTDSVKGETAAEATTTSSAAEPAETAKVTPASSASEPTEAPKVTPASSASEPTEAPKVTPTPVATEASSASNPTTTPEVSSDPKPAEASSASDGEFGSTPPPVAPSGPKPERHSTLVPLVGTLVALAAVAALLIGSMALPIARSGPSDVPVGVAGTEDVVGQLTTLMEQFGGEGTFEVQQFDSQNALAEAIEDREVYGGLFVDNTQAQMMIATAAGIEVSDALQTVANALQSQAQAQVTVTDVVAQPTEDPRGDGLSAAELPLAIAAALPAFALIALYRRRPLAQIGGAVLASAGLGLAIAAVLNYGAGSTAGGNFWLLSAGLAGGTFATTLILLGVYALTGRIGLGIGAAVLVLFGAPLSGLSSVPEWLPDPWGTLGQMLPPGATATALRSMAFFDGAGSRSALLVMLMWAAVGLVLLGLGTLLHRSNERLAELQAEEQAALREAAAEDEKSPATV